MSRTSAVLALFVVAAVHAEVYRCESDGRITYTDQACDAQTQPQALPPLTVAPQASTEHELAREYERRIEHERQMRDRADAEWNQGYRLRKDRAAAIRHARIAGKVVKGMDYDDVRGVWGEPQETTREERDGVPWERWTYRNGGDTRSVQFRGGEVHSSRTQRARKKK